MAVRHSGEIYRKTRGPRWQWPVVVRILFVAGLFFLAGMMLSRLTGFWQPARPGKAPPVRLGIENLADYQDVFRGRRVGLITNTTGVNGQWVPSAEILAAKTNLVALFAPEHGLQGTAVAGAAIPHEKDARTGLPIYSLHGDTRRPTAAMLQNIDVLAFDIQDIGVRPYTYISTLAYAMQSAREQGKTFVVFDRPNPLGGEKVEGGLLKPAFSSFIGLYPIPMRHGLTVGELARLFNEEFGIGAKLVVIPMKGWRRSLQQEDTALPWIMTSPNIPTPDSARAYCATALFGGSNVSEGIGTTRPFELVGAPWLDGRKLAERLNAYQLPGVFFRPVQFTPQWGKYQGRICRGVQIHVLDRRAFEPVAVGLYLLQEIRALGGTQFKWNAPKAGERWMIDLYEGGSELRQGRTGAAQLLTEWRRQATDFQQRAQKYRLYQ